MTEAEKQTLREQGLSELMIACLDGNIDDVHLILEQDDSIDINYFEPGRTYPPIVYACQSNNLEMVNYLIELNVNIDIQFTIIKDIVMNDYPNIIWDWGNEDDIDRWTPLMWACKCGSSEEIIDLLIDNGADLSATATHYVDAVGDFSAWQTPFFYNRPLLGTRLKNEMIEIQEDDEMDEPMDEPMDELMDEPIDEHTLRQVAIQCIALRQYDSIRELMSTHPEINLNAMEDGGLIAVCDYFNDRFNYDMTLIDILLTYGANVNTRDEFYNQTPLIWASKQGYTDVVDRLLAHESIDINASIEWRPLDRPLEECRGLYRTALMMAAKYGHIDVVNRLLQHGADPLLTDQNGKTALMLACEEGHLACLDMLICVTLNGHEVDDFSNTCLMLACQNGHIDIVQRLLELSVNVNATNNNGDSALIIASREGHVDIVRQLLGVASIDRHAINEQGETAISVANHEIRELLRRFNAPAELAVDLGLFGTKRSRDDSEDKPDDENAPDHKRARF